MKHFLLLLACLMSFTALAQSDEQEQILSTAYQMIQRSEAFSKSFTGFALYDPAAERMLLDINADRYFTPASNTKILTLYTTLKVLGDSMPAFRYASSGDTLIFWGTANPMFLNPKLPQDTNSLSVLRDSTCELFFSTHNFKDKRYGPGWAWDDYNYDFQVEKSSFPIYGNLAYFGRERMREGFTAYPPYFQSRLVFNPRMENGRPEVARQEGRNVFEYNEAALSGRPFYQEVPFNTSPEVIAELLSDTLGQPVQLMDLGSMPPMAATTHRVHLPDTVLRRMMQESDNFLAEQLLLACAEKLSGSQSAMQAIRYAKDSLFSSLEDELLWRDGSGLSRYNLFTPRALVQVLSLLYRDVERERLLSLFPAGGVSGTLKRYYRGGRQPYIYAKTGTLSNRHCLSGYLITDSGRTLIFSFMHNNYVQGTVPIKRDMEQVLRYLRQRL